MNHLHVLTTDIWDVLNVNANRMKLLLRENQRCLNHVSLLEQLKNYQVAKTSRKDGCVAHDMERHARKCVERYCELANKKVEQLCKVSSPCLDDNYSRRRREFSKICSQIDLKCLYLARIGRPDISWSVNKIAGAVTKWTQACDRRLARLISYINHPNDYRQCCHVAKSTSESVLCIFGSRALVPISWICKKQTSVHHSSAESEIISLDAGLRMDGLLALDLWDVVIEVLRSANNTKIPIRLAPGNWCGSGNHSSNKTKTKNTN